MLDLDAVARDILGESVLDRIYDDRKKVSDRFTQLRYTHPAIFMLEYSLTQLFLEEGIEPDYLLGSSLGEFTSAVVAGMLSPERAIEALLMQVQAIEAYCPAGGMTTVLHDTKLFEEDRFLSWMVELAGVNFDKHFILSGTREAIDAAERYLSSRDIVYQSLPVQYGFHSSAIDAMEQEYRQRARGFSLLPPAIPLISTVYAETLPAVGEDYFWDLIRKPISFGKAVDLLEQGEGCFYYDLGPSGTMATLLKYKLEKTSASQAFAVLNPFGFKSNVLESLQVQLSHRYSFSA